MSDDNWGVALWDKYDEVTKFTSDQLNLIEGFSYFIHKRQKAILHYQEQVEKANKAMKDCLSRKKRLEMTSNNTIENYIKKIVETYDSIDGVMKGFGETLKECCISINKTSESAVADYKKATAEYEKNTKIFKTLKGNASTARKTLLTRKIEYDTAKKQVGLVDQSDANSSKYRKMMSELKDRSKVVEKVNSAFQKSKEKLLTFSSTYYQESLPRTLCTYEHTQTTLFVFISETLESLLKDHVRYLETCVKELQECHDKHCSVDTEKDLNDFTSAYQSKTLPPKVEQIESVDLDDLAKRVQEPTASTQTETDSRKVTMLKSVSNAEALEKEKEDLDQYKQELEVMKKMALAGNQVGTGSDELQSQISGLEKKIQNSNQLINQLEMCQDGALNTTLDQSADNGSESKVTIIRNLTDLTAKSNSLSEVDEKNHHDSQKNVTCPKTTTDVCTKKMAYAFEATTDVELSVSADDVVVIIEEDNGCGWTLVYKVGQESVSGYVPTNFFQ